MGAATGVESGAAFLLRMSNGAEEETFDVVAGMRTTQLSFSSETIVTTHKGSGGWRELLQAGGIRSVSVSGAGVFTGSEAELRLKSRAMMGGVDRFELSFESGERIRGQFQVTRLDYAGDFNAERTYTLNLESSGPVEIL